VGFRLRETIMYDATTELGDLIAEATELVERRPRDAVALRLVRDDLAAAVGGCDDPAVTGDACDLLGEIDRALGTSRAWALAS
jgi:hypothetical protein